MAKVSLGGLPKFNNNPYLNKDKEVVESKDSSTVPIEPKVLVQETDFIVPKIDVPKKIKMTNFSYYGKLENINKIKKLSKHYKVSPSTLIDSILEAYFNNNQVSKD